MKRLLFTLFTVVFASTLLVHAESIRLQKDEAPRERRSIVIAPTAALDGSTISIYSVMTIQNVQVSVKDMMGNVIYTSTITIAADQHYSFTLDGAENGDYILEVTYDDKRFYGYFTL